MHVNLHSLVLGGVAESIVRFAQIGLVLGGVEESCQSRFASDEANFII